jgi:hypothetical protein
VPPRSDSSDAGQRVDGGAHLVTGDDQIRVTAGVGVTDTDRVPGILEQSDVVVVVAEGDVPSAADRQRRQGQALSTAVGDRSTRSSA